MTNAKEKPFDFGSLDLAVAADVPYEFEIEHPETGDGLGVFVSVIGSESETFQTYLRSEGNALRRQAFEAQRKGKPDAPMLIEDEEETGLRALATCIKGWRTVVEGKSDPAILIGGARLEYTPDAALTWLRKFRWVRVQVNKATGSLSNYLGNSSTASVSSPKPSSS